MAEAVNTLDRSPVVASGFLVPENCKVPRKGQKPVI